MPDIEHEPDAVAADLQQTASLTTEELLEKIANLSIPQRILLRALLALIRHG